MRRAVLSAAAFCVLSTAAVGQSPTMMEATPSALSTADFVKKVAIGDMYEIQSSQMALGKNADTDTKPFAERMVRDHEQTTQELKELVQSGKVKEQLPTALDDDHKRKLDDLAKLTGKEFDKAYDGAQKEAHQEAVALFEGYAKRGDNEDLKQWAAKTLPHLK